MREGTDGLLLRRSPFGAQLLRALLEEFNESLAGVGAVVEGLHEPLVHAEIGIGNDGFIELIGVAHHELNLVTELRGRALLELREHFPVHCEDKVVLREILGRSDGRGGLQAARHGGGR